MTPTPIITGSTTECPTHSILGSGYELLIDSESTDGAYELMKWVVPPGLGPPKHMHTLEDEHYYFLTGEFEVHVGQETVAAKPGTFLHLPRFVPHGLTNTGPTEGSFLCWVIPGNLGPLFKQLTKPWAKDSPQPPILNQSDIEKMTRLAKQFGITQAID